MQSVIQRHNATGMDYVFSGEGPWTIQKTEAQEVWPPALGHCVAWLRLGPMGPVGTNSLLTVLVAKGPRVCAWHVHGTCFVSTCKGEGHHRRGATPPGFSICVASDQLCSPDKLLPLSGAQPLYSFTHYWGGSTSVLSSRAW